MMTTFLLVSLAIIGTWLVFTVLACLFLARAADDLAEALRRKSWVLSRKNRRRHTLGAKLMATGQLRRI
jgi:hypothetical protein